MRFEDTPELFGCGAGIGTCGDIKCGICGGLWNEGESEREVYDNPSVSITDFAGIRVCECCFERIEEEVWDRRQDILAWFKRRMDAREHAQAADRAALNQTTRPAQTNPTPKGTS